MSSDFGISDKNRDLISKVFQNFSDVKEVTLYGSRAIGTFKPGSDIDLCITKGMIDLSTLLKIETELDDLMLPYKVDLSCFETIDNPNVREHISKFGKIFYTR